MATVVLAEIDGAVLSMTVSAQNRITDMALDASLATRAVTLTYPVEAPKVTVTAQPGDVLTRSFVGANQLDRVMTTMLNAKGVQQSIQTAPTWRLGN